VTNDGAWYQPNLDYHSAKIIPPKTARAAVKPTLTDVEMASFVGLLVLLAVEPVSVPDPVEPPEVPDGVAVELALKFKALDKNAAYV